MFNQVNLHDLGLDFQEYDPGMILEQFFEFFGEFWHFFLFKANLAIFSEIFGKISHFFEIFLTKLF